MAKATKKPSGKSAAKSSGVNGDPQDLTTSGAEDTSDATVPGSPAGPPPEFGALPETVDVDATALEMPDDAEPFGPGTPAGDRSDVSVEDSLDAPPADGIEDSSWSAATPPAEPEPADGPDALPGAASAPVFPGDPGPHLTDELTDAPEAPGAEVDAADSPSGADPIPEAGSADRGAEAPAAAPQAADAQGSGGGFVAGLLGAALAVAAGIGILWVSNPDLLRGETPGIAPLLERIDAQQAETETLAQDLAALREDVAAGAEAGDGGLGDRVGALEGDVAGRLEALAGSVEAVRDQLGVLEGRIAQVESRPPVMEGETASDITAEVVSQMRAELDAQRAEIATMAEEARGQVEAASTAASAAVGRAALSRLQAALEGGGPYSGALSDLSGVRDAEVSEALITHADTGIPTLGELQRSFPVAARAALTASIRAGVGDDATPMERFGAFLKAQTGARAITPREGDDPDAVLSRAEAALNEGELPEALALLDTLPEAGQEALAEWREGAQARADAVAAAEALAASLQAN